MSPSPLAFGTRLLHGIRKRGRRLVDNAPPGLFLENRREARRLIALGDRALVAGVTAEAESFALRALCVAPASLESLHLLGRVLDATGRHDEAIRCHGGHLPSEIWERHAGALPPVAEGAARRERLAVFDGVRIRMPPPRGIAAPAPGVFDRDDIVGAASFVDRVSGGRVWQDAHDTLVLDAEGRAVGEHTLGNPHVVRHISAAHEPVHLGRRVFVLGARGSGNYYHWMTDILPKLELCRRAGFAFGPEDRFLIPTRRAAFQLASLARFGIRERQLHVANVASPWVAADELVVPYLRNTMGNTMGAWLPEFLKDTFLPSGPRPRPTRRIFVSRDVRRSQGRGIENLAEVEACFAERGFEIVFPETLDLAGQARLFAEAAVVAGPHGAGLANIVFCAPGTRVIEFYGAHLAPCYRAISALAGLDYHAHFCLEEMAERDDGALARSLVARRTAGFAIPLASARAMLDLAVPD